MSFSADSMLRMVGDMVGNVVSQLGSQSQTVDGDVMGPVKAIVEQVTGGMWVGKGADAFVEEVATMLIPGIGQILEQIGSMSGNIQFAQDTIEQADQSASQQILGGLEQAFAFFS